MPQSLPLLSEAEPRNYTPSTRSSCRSGCVRTASGLRPTGRDSRPEIKAHGRLACVVSESAQTPKDDPQPQVVVALGLRMTNWAPCSPSV